ncbi:MAG: hypothetical protein QOE74_1582, partial [Mycobacterium sp.]|nr:hypothetical protein [Mycobacterium sp.]
MAFWLTRNRYRVVVVESAPGIRPGGQTVDLRGAGADVVQRMGLLDEMTRRAVDQRGIAWVRSDGSRRTEMPVEAFDGNGVVSKLEILRGDLVDVLYEATRDVAEYRFGTRVSQLAHDGDGVVATLTDGTPVEADLVVGADGPNSAVRRLTFGPEEQFVTPLGGYHAWFLRTGPGRHRRLVPDAPCRGWPECLDASITRSSDGQGGLGLSVRAAGLRPTRSERPASAARREVRWRGVAV